MTKKALSVLYVFMCAITAPYQYCSAQTSPSDSGVITEFATRLNNDTKKDDVHGSISAAIVKDGKVIWARAFGFAARDKNLAADTGPIYRIGSITKTRSLKGYSDKTIITLRQLASHTSGLKREPDLH